MRIHIPGIILSMLCLPFITAAKPLPELVATTTDRPWVLEDEFASNPTLHATRDQTVVLQLEGRGDSANAGHAGLAQGAIRRNTFRFLIEEAGDFSFCIPEGEPDIVRLKLKGPMSHGKGRAGTLLVITLGDACELVSLVPGSHTVEVDHDSRGILNGGRKAFFHQPQKARLLADVQTAFGTPDFIAFRAPNGKFVGGSSASSGGATLATASNVSPNEVWDLLAFNATNVDAGTMYLLAPANGQGLMLNLDPILDPSCDNSTTIFVFPPIDCVFLPSPFHFNDQGGGKFNLVLDTVGYSTDLLYFIIAGIYIDESEILFYDTSKPFRGATLTWEYKGFDCATTCDDTTLPLGTGEIALYAQCDFQGPAMVFNANVADMSTYDSAAAAGVAIGNDMVSSIRVGPDTLAILYKESQFGGNSEGIGADLACLNTTALGENTASSFQIKSASEFIVTADGCQECVLTGIDLSGEDFSNGDFTRSILDGANLTDTIFSGATLASTHFSSAALSGTDFSGADLSCAQFNNADLTSATFQGNRIAVKHSCYLNLRGATLDYTTFPAEKWRYFDLSGTTMNNVPQVLSTATAPLDLSGAILSYVGWLAGKQLDSINLGCYASQASQTTVCPPPNASVSLERETLPGPDGPAMCTAKTSPWNIVNGEYSLEWQGDGNLVLYRNGEVQWATHTQSSGDELCWQGDGNLVIRSSGAAVWASNTADTEHGGNGGRLLTLWSNGLLEITDPSGESIWHQGPFGSAVCTTLQGTVLTKASLKNACLQNASMEGAFLSLSNLDGADMSGAQLQAITGGKVTTLEGAFMRNVNLSGANLTGVNASNVDFYSTSSGTADATDMTAPGANFSGAYLAGADFSGSNSNLQSTLWSSAMLLGANFTQADLTTNTSGGVNSGTNTTFNGAYLQGVVFESAMLDDVDFTSTYWDALGSGGSLNFLIPKQNLGFSGYWKDIGLPECPPSLSYDSGNPPPMMVTDANNTCPNGLPGPCDTVWDQPLQDISLAFFQSAVPPLFPQDTSVAADMQCSGSFSDPNPLDFCWITTNNPTLCSEN